MKKISILFMFVFLIGCEEKPKEKECDINCKLEKISKLKKEYK